MPEIAQAKVPVICVHGDEEGDDSFCQTLAGKPNVRQLVLPGGHHYNGDYDKLGAGIAGSLPARKNERPDVPDRERLKPSCRNPRVASFGNAPRSSICTALP